MGFFWKKTKKFFHECETLHYLELVYSKNYFDLTKIFVLRQQIKQCSRLKQKSVIKFLLAEKCKPCEIHRRMYDVYREACFIQKNVYKWAKHEFATMSKRKSMEWTHIDFLVKKRFWMQLSVKKVMLTVFLDLKEPTTIDFLEKAATVNNAFYCQLLGQNSPYLLNDLCIYSLSRSQHC